MWNTFRETYRKKHNKDGQKGAVTVEAVVAFVGFLFVIFTILNVVNFCRAQVLVSNAVDTVTKELTQYSYLYNISGLQKFDSDIHDIGQTGKDNLNAVAGSVGNLYSAMSTAVGTSIEEGTNLANATMDGSVTEDMVTTALNSLEADGTNISTSINNMTTEFATVGDNPVLYMKSIVAVAGSEGLDALKSHLIAAPLAKALMVKHFGGSWSEADRQLEALGVVDGLDGMNFGMSTLFCEGEEEDVHIVLYYKLKVVQLFPWADFEAAMCKESHARAWLGGDDVVVKVAAPRFDSTNTGGGEEPPAEEEEEEEAAPDAEAIKAAMVEKYGQEVVDAVSDGEDTSAWTEDDWEYRIWWYQNAENPDAQIDETELNDGLTNEQIQFLMSSEYGQDIVTMILADNNTSNWTQDDWEKAILCYMYMSQNEPDTFNRVRMINKYGYETVNAVSAGVDTSLWTADEWEDNIGLYLRNTRAGEEENKEEESTAGRTKYDNINIDELKTSDPNLLDEIVDDIRRNGNSPIDIPEDVSINAKSMTKGYQQIKYQWTEGDYKYEARWHTETPGAVQYDRGTTWVITRTIPGNAQGQKRVTEYLVGD